MQDIYTFNAFETVKSVDVPVYFLAGKYDYTCCYELQKEYFDFWKPPEKYFTLLKTPHTVRSLKNLKKQRE